MDEERLYICTNKFNEWLSEVKKCVHNTFSNNGIEISEDEIQEVVKKIMIG